ncbi:hypothetical protein [Arenimonas oryziterrae]|uniref:Uncharacterized protein n=1 Tax=Arenimonas oryziterrae DSM 21050 = YC6267 TaxID=1121015 RepID=A0A091AW37_9GAMM|nr:hypothetical protein [Arenimonas oryziterrae]KFN43671.1 hypothetical protein N789_10365 [Arenimonas oryziterrae DSM 21050 = YC6267]
MFKLTRFRRLAAAHWAEQWRTYAWFLGIGVIVHFVLVLILLLPDDGFRALSTGGQAAFFYTGLYLTAPIFAGRYFQAMTRPESSLVLLMRPASSFEKWLLAFLVVAVAYPLAYILAYNVCNIPAGLIAAAQAHNAYVLSAAAGNDNLGYLLKPENFELYFVWEHIDRAYLWMVILSLGALQGFAVLGSLYFRAMPFIKTILAAFFVLLAVIFLASVLSTQPDLFFGYWSSVWELPTWQSTLFAAAWVGVPVLLWIACLFALREREIA